MEILPPDPEITRILSIRQKGLHLILEGEEEWRRECPGYILAHGPRFLGSFPTGADAWAAVDRLGIDPMEISMVYMAPAGVLRVGV